MTRHVYLAELTPGASAVTVTGAEAKHMGVKRTKVGEQVDLVDGAGTRAVVTVTDLGPQVTCAVDAWVTDERPAQPITLVQGLVKGGRDDAAVEAAIEVGVTRIIPWQSDRAIAKWTGKEKKNREKWQQIATAAMKQSRSSFLPEVADVVTTRGLVALARQADARLLVLHEEATEKLTSVELGNSQIWLVVGPEGGISPDELDLLSSVGATPVLLGPTVLRAGTAGIAGAAILQARTGQW